MSEWWSYRPSDFLLFSPQTYQRLFELYNAALWPAPLFAGAIGLALVLLALKGRPAVAARAALLLLAACWWWVAWAFHLQRYAAINWAATGFAAGFALQGLLLLGAAGLEWRRARGARRAAGLALMCFAILIAPWLGLALRGRPLTEAELFGMAPDPTALATVGWLLVLRPAADARWARLLLGLAWPLPLLWCAIGALTQWTILGAQG
jgi:hypothetical protein